MAKSKLKNKKSNRKSAVILLLFMVLLGVFPIDVLLPSVPALSQHFNRPPSDITLSISFFAVGISASQLVIGPLSDRTGRKKILLVGMAISMIGALGCALSSDYRLFMLSRVIQAIGCGCFVLSQALVQDLFNEKDRDRLRILITTASGVFISISPLAGAFLQSLLNWPGSFYLFFALSAAVFITTYLTLDTPSPEGRSQHSILNSYRHICADKKFISYWAIAALVFSCHFSFIVVSPLILIEQLGLSQYQFSLALLLYGFAYITGGTLAGLLSNRLAAHAQITIGLCLIFGAGILLIYLSNRLEVSVLTILPPMVICTAGITLARPAATSKAMERFPRHAGASASAGNTLVFICGGLISALVSLCATELQPTLGWTFFLLSLVGLGLNVMAQQHGQGVTE